MHRLTLPAFASALALALSACTAKTPDLPASYRDPGDPIYSSATLDVARLAGDWQQVGAYGGQGCAPGAARFAGSPGAMRLAFDLCLSGRMVQGDAALTAAGPGRFAVAGLPGDLWLLWVDTDVRTLVFGTPSGAYGFVLNRGGDLPADRARALREILDWNGYDPAALTLW